MSSTRLWIFRLVLAAGLAVGLGYLPYQASGGVRRALRLEKQYEQLTDSNLSMQKHNARLRRQIRELKDDHRVAERVARDELGLVRENDLVFQLR